ncbi:MAG: hypothetical protein M0P69_12290, partial [Bacteroidales bacterium]|nr:hypothetical protein [Bacteroidales bacterium]
MITKNYNVHVDFNGGVQYTPITFVQNDFGTGSLTYDIEQAIGDARVVTTFRTPNDVSFAIQATKIDEHTAVLNMPATALTSQGVVDCQIALYEDGVRLTNIVSYEITVQADLSGEATVDPEEYTIVQQLLAEIDGFQEAEALRVLNEGAEDPPSGRVGAELAREAAEDARGVAYLAAEGDRNTAYETAEGLRDTAYGAQEDVRDGQYATAEGLRDTAYGAQEDVRDGQYSTAEGLRDTAYDTAEGVRDGQYAAAEGLRDTAYDTAETARNLFENYSNVKQYVVGNKVTYYGSSYVCVKSSLGNTPIT